jgi:prepilin-type N-terminal cleavage/methylation domain-containing protein
MNNRRSGFTLIELMAVIFILGLMAGAVTLTVQRIVDRARWTRGFAQLELVDRVARMAARNERISYRLSFSRSKRRIELRPEENITAGKGLRQWKLPRGLDFASFREDRSSSRSDEMKIEINSSGQSSSYAVALKASSGPSRWMVILGLSGQPIQLDQADDVVAIMPR